MQRAAVVACGVQRRCELHSIVDVMHRHLVPDVHRRDPQRISAVSRKVIAFIACSVRRSLRLRDERDERERRDEEVD